MNMCCVISKRIKPSSQNIQVVRKTDYLIFIENRSEFIYFNRQPLAHLETLVMLEAQCHIAGWHVKIHCDAKILISMRIFLLRHRFAAEFNIQRGLGWRGGVFLRLVFALTTPCRFHIMHRNDLYSNYFWRSCSVRSGPSKRASAHIRSLA